MDIHILTKYDTCVLNPVPQKRLVSVHGCHSDAYSTMVYDYEYNCKIMSDSGGYKIISNKITDYHAEIVYIWFNSTTKQDTKWAISWDIS